MGGLQSFLSSYVVFALEPQTYGGLTRPDVILLVESLSLPEIIGDRSDKPRPFTTLLVTRNGRFIVSRHLINEALLSAARHSIRQPEVLWGR